jgi:hypothetical protein
VALLNDVRLAPVGSTGTGRFSAGNLRGARRLAVVFKVEAVGATPTVTFTVQGSLDGTNWTTLAVAQLDSSVAVSNSPITMTAVGLTERFVDGLDKRFYEFIAVNVTANTNVTFSAKAYQQDN